MIDFYSLCRPGTPGVFPVPAAVELEPGEGRRFVLTISPVDNIGALGILGATDGLQRLLVTLDPGSAHSASAVFRADLSDCLPVTVQEKFRVGMREAVYLAGMLRDLVRYQ